MEFVKGLKAGVSIGDTLDATRDDGGGRKILPCMRPPGAIP